jgi:hypothetical protein
LLKLSLIFALCSLLFAPLNTRAENSFEEAAKFLPDRIGEYRAVAKAQPLRDNQDASAYQAEAFNALSSSTRAYRSDKGEQFSLTVTRMRSDSSAYSLLTGLAQSSRRMDSSSQTVKTGEVGTASFVLPDRILFFKGLLLVAVDGLKNRPANPDERLAFARSFADILDAGDGEIPVLVKHLPDWERVSGTAAYAVSHTGLQTITGQRPVLEAVSFEGGAEAVAATYDKANLVIIEHTTPQLATDDDARINAKISELKSGGQPVPTLYRRVGNYAVFVFDAPDEATAAQLIDKINYEQVVQWLGNNPHWMERAEREYRQTTAGVILSVIKGTGLSLLICLGIGGIFGSIIFKRRRTQAAMTEAYSDAGGMLRLNLDEMTPRVDPSRLLGKGDG